MGRCGRNAGTPDQPTGDSWMRRVPRDQRSSRPLGLVVPVQGSPAVGRCSFPIFFTGHPRRSAARQIIRSCVEPDGSHHAGSIPGPIGPEAPTEAICNRWWLGIHRPTPSEGQAMNAAASRKPPIRGPSERSGVWRSRQLVPGARCGHAGRARCVGRLMTLDPGHMTRPAPGWPRRAPRSRGLRRLSPQKQPEAG